MDDQSIPFHAEPDLSRIDLTDVDRLGALRILQFSAGGKRFLRGNERITISFSALGSVYAINNPMVRQIGAGVTVRGFRKAKPE